MLKIVPLEHEHLVAFYGPAGKGPTVKGIAAFVDGELAAVGGFAFLGGKVLAFCELKDAVRPFKTAIHRTAVRALREAGKRHRMIMVDCDPNEPTAPRWLKRLGFVETDGGRWLWRA